MHLLQVYEKNYESNMLLRHNNKTIVALLLLLFVPLYVSINWGSFTLVKDDAKIFLTHFHQVQLTKLTTKNAIETYRKNANVTVDTLPIHIIQPSSNDLTVLPWGTLRKQWDRTTEFEHLIQLSSQDTTILPPIPPNHRVVIIIHCVPKMGSLTLRKACRDNLKTSCGMESKLQIDPNGYSNTKELAEIIRQCNTTHHFCQRRGVFNSRGWGRPKSWIDPFDKIVFMHLYPFRNYDSWTVSALKQSYDRGGRKECNEAKEWMDKCSDKHGELAFFKYPKSQMSEAQPLMVHRINEMKETHHIILYPFLEIDGLLSLLSKEYQIPLLPGSNGTDHVKRDPGNCDKTILDKFHECFTHKLAELP